MVAPDRQERKKIREKFHNPYFTKSIWVMGVKGHDQISWPVNLVMFLDRCDSAVSIVVALYIYVTLNSTPFVYVYFEATLFVVGLPGVLWHHVWGSGCVYL